jgi:hypothetical protein
MRSIGHHPTQSSVRQHCPLAALRELLTDDEIEVVCRQLGHAWRARLLPPAVTVRSMVWRGLHPDKSIANLLADLAAAQDIPDAGPTDAAWCQARSRLPQELWPRLLQDSARRLVALADDRQRYQGRPLYVVDGTTLSMPDEPALARAFGRTRTRHGPSRFPVGRLTFLLRAGAEAILDWRFDRFRTSEDEQFHALWHHLPEGAVCLFDRYFSSFYNLAKLQSRGLDVVSRLHQRRRPERLCLQGRQIGREEWIVPLRLAPQLRRRYDDPSLPEVVHVRLIRVRRGRQAPVWLVTTLLDPRRHPRRQIVRLYRRRWGIETRLASLKTQLQLDVLRSKTPDNVRSEVAATLLAHNLVWTIIQQAARRTRRSPQRLSFTGTVQVILAYAPRLRQADPQQRPHLYHAMLAQIARRTNRYRPRRTEPRLIKRDPVRFAYLRIPRDKARLKCLT